MNGHGADRPVVVGVDGTRVSMQAVAWAARTAALRRSPLLVLHVRQPDALPWEVTSLLRAGLRHAREIDPYARLRVRAVTDDVDTGLVAASVEAALLVLGLDPTRPRGAHGLRGPIEDRVANHACCPVVLVPGPGSTDAHPDVVALVSGDAPGMCVASIAAQEAARRSASLFVYVREVDGNPSAAELTDRAMLEITFDHPMLPVRLTILGAGRAPLMVWEPVDRLALVVTSTQADTDPWAIRSDPYGTLLARRLRVPVMLVTPLTFRSMCPSQEVVQAGAAREASRV